MFIQSNRQTHSHTKEIRVYSQIEQKVETQDKLVPLRAHDQSHSQSTFPLLLALLESWAADGQQLSVCPGGLLPPSPKDTACPGGIHLCRDAPAWPLTLSPSREKYLPMLMFSFNARWCSAVASSMSSAP